MKRRIGMILDQKFPPDVRVENEALSLVRAGFEVYLFCYAYKQEATEEDYRGIQIRRIRASHDRIKRMRALVNVIPVYEKYLLHKILSFIEKNHIDILHVHDLYLLGICLKIKDLTGITIVSDLHENYVEGLRYYNFANTFPGNILINLNKWRRAEIAWLTRVDKIIVVVQEAAQRLKLLGIDDRKIAVVENYLNYVDYDLQALQLDIVERYKYQFIMSYIGRIDFHRGLHTVVEAMQRLKSNSLPVKFVIVGSGTISKQLKLKTNTSALEDQIEFLGLQPHEHLRSYVEASTIGIIPHLKTGHTDNTLPHKLFHYMYLKKPVLVSNCDPLKRIVEHCSCGKVFINGDPQDLAAKIEWFWYNAESLDRMGNNGYQALMKEYNWDNAEKRLISLYEKIEQR